MKTSEPLDHGLPGYNWTVKKLRRWVKQVLRCEVSRRVLSDILKKNRLNGAYDFSQGQCFIWGPEGSPGGCNGDNTIKFLHHLTEWLAPVTSPVFIIWDGVPCHRAQIVQTAAAEMGFTLLPLPGYSPDLNPIEGLWKWMREELTQNHCYLTMRELFDACKAFIHGINADPLQIISRLWPKFDLDPDFEKLLVSK